MLDAFLAVLRTVLAIGFGVLGLFVAAGLAGAVAMNAQRRRDYRRPEMRRTLHRADVRREKTMTSADFSRRHGLPSDN